MPEKLLPTLLLVWVPYFLSSNNKLIEGLMCYVCSNCPKPEEKYLEECVDSKYCCKIVLSKREGTEVWRRCMAEHCESILGMLDLEPPAIKTYSCRTNSCNTATAFDFDKPLTALATGFSLMKLYEK